MIGLIIAASFAAQPPPPPPPPTRAEVLERVLAELRDDPDEGLRYMDSYCWYEDGYTVCVWYNNGGGCVEVCSGSGYCDVGCW